MKGHPLNLNEEERRRVEPRPEIAGGEAQALAPREEPSFAVPES